MTIFMDILTLVSVSVGTFFFLAGTAGLLRFPDTLSRLHALTKADNLGLGLIILGLLPRVDGPLAAIRLLLVWALALLGSVSASRLVARAARKEP